MSLFDVVPRGRSEEDRMEDALDARAFTMRSEVDTGDALIAEAAKSDSSAFGELYERYYVRVYRYVYHRVGNAADAEDVTALIFMKALEGLPSFQSQRNSFAPWLFRIARNAVVDHYRRRRSQTSFEDLGYEAEHGDPIVAVLGGERGQELRCLVNTLSPDQRDVILMRYASDLSFAEIALSLKKNEPAIRMLLHRGLRKLKAVLDDD
jgi:RNA polymerase sigma-70 factor (ECF subfamily)